MLPQRNNHEFLKMIPKPIVLSGQERNSLKVPLDVFINDDGTLKFHETVDRGLIEVRQGAQGLELKLGGIVGRLAITKTHVIDISPKFSMGNLARLMAISDERLSNRVEVDRLYSLSNPNGFLPELLIKSFAQYLEKSVQEGLHRQYIKKISSTSVRPKVNFNKSAQQFWSRGKLTEAITEQFQFDYDNIENQILKAACLIAISLSKSTIGMSADIAIFADTLRSLDRVSIERPQALLERFSISGSRIPSFKTNLHKSVEIAIELIKRSGILYDRFDGSISLPSYLLNLEDAFESYVRNVLRSGLSKKTNSIQIGDGNETKWQKPLFDDNAGSKAQPDFIVQLAGESTPKLIGDVKYKRKVAVEDRYQIISHALSYKCKLAIIVTPSLHGETSKLTRVGKLGPSSNEIEIYEHRMDLSGDMIQEEDTLCKAILKIMNI